MNRPLEIDASPAADMAVINGVRPNMGRMPVPTFIRLVAVARVVSRVRVSRPEPSVIQSVS